MEEVLEKVNKEENKSKNNEKKKFKIFGFTIIQIFAYFIIYSVIGFIIETIFGFLTKGVIESRKSFIYGPFCAIYGLGAVVMLMGLQRFKKNNYTLFIGGFIIGSIIEYVVSLVGELLFDIKWWDYSNVPFNIGGRVCVWFSLFWGLLAIYLVTHIHPKVDSFLGKIPKRILKSTTIILIVLLFLDFLITCFALKMFYVRLVNDYDLDIKGVDKYLEKYTELYENPNVKKFVDTHFSNEKMLKTFPNIKVTQNNGNIIWICDILVDIQPYYIRVFTPKINR
jgi:uncharacterized membrane protein